MKKIVLSLAALLTVGAATLSANPLPEPNPKALEVFNREFASARFAKWSEDEGLAKVSFVLGGTRAIAFFDEGGELLGSIRDLTFNQLPLAVLTSIDKRYKDAAIYDFRELTNAEGTRYTMTVEDKGKKISVTLFANGQLADVRKLK